MQAGGREFESLYLHSVRKRKFYYRSRTLKTAYTKHLKYVKRKIETKRGAVEIQRRNRNKRQHQPSDVNAMQDLNGKTETQGGCLGTKSR